MKGKLCIGLLTLFTIFSLSLSLSSDVNAYDGWVDNPYVSGIRSYNVNGSITESASMSGTPPIIQLYSSPNRYFYGLRINALNVSSGDYKSYNTIYLTATLTGQDYWWQDYGNVANTGFSVYASDNNYYSGTCSTVDSGTNFMQQRCSLTLERDLTPVNVTFRWGTVTSISSSTAPLALVSNSNLVLSYVGWGYDASDSAELAAINKTNELLTETNDILQQQNEQDQQDRDNINQASDDADASSGASQQQAEQTGTTLLKAFTDFVGALTNAQPSNCNLNMDLGNLDMGIVNLCSLSPPPVFQTIASIFMILFCVPLSIATARKVINLFRSFQ